MKKNLFIFIIILLLGLVALMLFKGKNLGNSKKELSDFAVKDTGSITKIFLADKFGQTILLEKIEGQWMVDDQYIVRKDAIQLMLETVSKVRVKAPVPKSAFQTIVKQIAGNSVKVEIYTGDDDPYKVYYVGGPNPEHDGTYMLMEESSVPFLTHIEGFRGYLTPRFFMDQGEWRSKAAFQYNYGEMDQLKLINHKDTTQNFSIEFGNRQWVLKNHQSTSVLFDTAKVLHYSSLFKEINIESYLSDEADSLLQDSLKLYTFLITSRGGVKNTLTLYKKPLEEAFTNIGGQLVLYDVDRMYGKLGNGEVVVAQYFVFDPLTRSISDFRN